MAGPRSIGSHAESGNRIRSQPLQRAPAHCQRSTYILLVWRPIRLRLPSLSWALASKEKRALARTGCGDRLSKQMPYCSSKGVYHAAGTTLCPTAGPEIKDLKQTDDYVKAQESQLSAEQRRMSSEWGCLKVTTTYVEPQ